MLNIHIYEYINKETKFIMLNFLLMKRVTRKFSLDNIIIIIIIYYCYYQFN